MSDARPHPVVAKQVTVHGLVQGVFFRDSARREAARLGVAGTARNDPAGTVSVRVEGDPEAVEAMLAWLRHGPSRAHVQRVEVLPAEPAGLTDFRIG